MSLKTITKIEVQQKVLKGGKPLSLDLFEWDENMRIFKSEINGLSINFRGISGCIFHISSNCSVNAEYDCTFYSKKHCNFRTESYCTFYTESNCLFITGDNCTFKSGSYCKFYTRSECVFDVRTRCDFETGQDCIFKVKSRCDFRIKIKGVFILNEKSEGNFVRVESSNGCVYRQKLKSQHYNYITHICYNRTPNILDIESLKLLFINRERHSFKRLMEKETAQEDKQWDFISENMLKQDKKHIKTISCINYPNHQNQKIKLTLNKVYSVITEHEEVYFILDDSGHTRYYSKEYFRVKRKGVLKNEY